MLLIFFFDALDNWVVHATCVRNRLGLSTNWAADTHRRAVLLSNTPTQEFAKRDLPDDEDAVLHRILLSPGCELSAPKYLKSLHDDKVTLATERVRVHGLVGTVGHNTRHEARRFFTVYVRSNCAPNGRTRDENGRFHGPLNYLDARFVILRKKKSSDTRLSFGGEVVAAMKNVEPFRSKPNLLVSEKTAALWLRELFIVRKSVRCEWSTSVQ